MQKDIQFTDARELVEKKGYKIERLERMSYHSVNSTLECIVVKSTFGITLIVTPDEQVLTEAEFAKSFPDYVESPVEWGME